MKIRINDLARELEVKSKAILDVLEEVGVTEKKTHSSSVERRERERGEKAFRAKPRPGCPRGGAPPGKKAPKNSSEKVQNPGGFPKPNKKKRPPPPPPPPPPAPAGPAGRRGDEA